MFLSWHACLSWYTGTVMYGTVKKKLLAGCVCKVHGTKRKKDYNSVKYPSIYVDMNPKERDEKWPWLYKCQVQSTFNFSVSLGMQPLLEHVVCWCLCLLNVVAFSISFWQWATVCLRLWKHTWLHASCLNCYDTQSGDCVLSCSGNKCGTVRCRLVWFSIWKC